MAKYMKTSKVHTSRPHQQILVVEIVKCDPFTSCKLEFKFQKLARKSNFVLLESDKTTACASWPEVSNWYMCSMLTSRSKPLNPSPNELQES
eukprot:6182611-Pleurochrysis_carterae.AAC.2